MSGVFTLRSRVLGVAALVASGTRLVAFALLCVGVVALARRRPALGLVLVAAIAAAVLAVSVDPQGFVQLLSRPGERPAHVLEFAGRTPIWSAAMELWSERPLLGYGWAANEVSFVEAFARDAIGFNAYTAHNLGIGVLIDLGALGLALLVLGLVAVWRHTRTHADARLVLLLVLVTGTIEATFSRPALVMVLLGAVAAVPSVRAVRGSTDAL